jgi:hypothetical protein
MAARHRVRICLTSWDCWQLFHWVTGETISGQHTRPGKLTQRIRGWTERKGRLFTEAHVRTATLSLAELGWIAAA